MKKLLFSMAFIAALLVGCDGGGSSSSEIELVTCSRCLGEKFIGNMVCPKCKGMGSYSKGYQPAGSQPSFGGSGSCTCGCPQFVGTINDQYCQRSGCHHPWGRHN